MSTVEQMMSQTAVLAAGRAQQELEVYKNVVMEVGCIPQLSDPEVPVADMHILMNISSRFYLYYNYYKSCHFRLSITIRFTVAYHPV
mgnify:CR=1 FL=1